MNTQNVVICAFLIFGCAIAGSIKDKSEPKAVVTIQATNNTLVPNIVYVVDAVEALKEAYSVYADEAMIAEAYLELYNAKHEGNWSVAVGYTTIISRATIYIETSVTDGKSLQSDKKGTLYRIFN